MGWEILLVVVPAVLAYAVYCFSQSLDIVSTGHTWLKAYRDLHASRQASALSGLLRDVLQPFVAGYFQLTVAEEPPPMSDAELVLRSEQVANEPDPRSKAFLFRELLTKPIANALVDGVQGQLVGVVGPTVTASAEVQGALMAIEVPSDSAVERIQLRFRRLRGFFLVQAGLAAILALLLVASGLFRQAGWLSASTAVAVPVLALGAFTHVEHWRLRGKLVPDRRPEELISGD